jgi:fructose-bisphosphate aldolase, class I
VISRLSAQRSSTVRSRTLNETATALFADSKGLLAMDESNPTCNKRFASLGIPQTADARRAYRELIVTTPGLSECIGGAILCDETIRQQTRVGIPFVKALEDAGIVPGIKVDMGANELAGHPGEKVTEGLDGLVPVVEPEVLMVGDYSLQRCSEVTEEVLRVVFSQFHTQGGVLEEMILKPNMVLPGSACPTQEAVDEVADATMNCLLRAVPAAVPAIAFLSGGQSAELASARLNSMIVRFNSRSPWAVAFSFARAIQQPALELWKGLDANVPAAQQALYHRACCNRAARCGEYSAEMEKR